MLLIYLLLVALHCNAEFTAKWWTPQTLFLGFCWHHMNAEINHLHTTHWKEGNKNSCPSPADRCATAQDVNFQHLSLQVALQSLTASSPSSLVTDDQTGDNMCTSEKTHFQNSSKWRHSEVEKESHSNCLLYNLVLQNSSMTRSPRCNSVPCSSLTTAVTFRAILQITEIWTRRFSN